MTFDEWIDDNMNSLHESTILGDLRRAFNAGMMADVHTDNSKVIETLEKENAELKEGKWYYTKNKDFPAIPGSYLVWRNWNGVQYPQILCFDGKFWVTGNDHPDNMIVAWKEIEPPEEA